MLNYKTRFQLEKSLEKILECKQVKKYKKQGIYINGTVFGIIVGDRIRTQENQERNMTIKKRFQIYLKHTQLSYYI